MIGSFPCPEVSPRSRSHERGLKVVRLGVVLFCGDASDSERGGVTLQSCDAIIVTKLVQTRGGGGETHQREMVGSERG